VEREPVDEGSYQDKAKLILFLRTYRQVAGRHCMRVVRTFTHVNTGANTM
jgi:hypothetical protein